MNCVSNDWLVSKYSKITLFTFANIRIHLSRTNTNLSAINYDRCCWICSFFYTDNSSFNQWTPFFIYETINSSCLFFICSYALCKKFAICKFSNFSEYKNEGTIRLEDVKFICCAFIISEYVYIHKMLQMRSFVYS